MAEDKNKLNALDLGSLATRGTQEEQLQEEQLEDAAGGTGGLTMASKLFKKLFE